MTDPATDRPDAEPVDEALVLLVAAVDDVDRQVGRLPDDLPVEETAALLRTLRHQRQLLAAVEAAVEARVAKALGRGDHEVAGLPVRVNQANRTTWIDPRTLAWRIVEPLVLDRQSGETHVDPDRAADMLDRLFDALQVAYFRTKTMRGQGVAYDDLMKREPGRRTVQFLSPSDGAG